MKDNKEKIALNTKVDNVTNEEYLNTYKENIELKQEIKKVKRDWSDVCDIVKNQESKYDKKIDTICSGGGIVLIIACFVSFCVGSCINGCAETEDRFVSNPITVISVQSYGENLSEYKISGGNHIIVIDKKGKYNIGDTIKLEK